jgi:transcriptional regulator with XRE-family HTH domain
MNNIKKARISSKLKQSELADILHVGQTTISNWETGYSEPDFEALKKMSDIFNCSIDELLGNKGKPVVKDDELSRKLSRLSDENLQRMEDYVDLLLKTQGE